MGSIKARVLWGAFPGCLHCSAQRPLDAGSSAGISHSPRCFLNRWFFAAFSGRSWSVWMNSSFLDAKKNTNFESTKNSLLSATKLLSKAFDRSHRPSTSVMESLWSWQDLLRERWCCARGWWIMAVRERPTKSARRRQQRTTGSGSTEENAKYRH